MRFLHKKRNRTPAVIIVSLIDVLLVVLIFLMVKIGRASCRERVFRTV